jgi:predicted transcriptional regulator
MGIPKGREMVPCGCCRGTGVVPLASTHAATLALLRRQGEPINGANLAKLAGCSSEAMCNRLLKLEEYGLAEGEHDGRQRLWVATAKPR